MVAKEVLGKIIGILWTVTKLFYGAVAECLRCSTRNLLIRDSSPLPVDSGEDNLSLL